MSAAARLLPPPALALRSGFFKRPLCPSVPLAPSPPPASTPGSPRLLARGEGIWTTPPRCLKEEKVGGGGGGGDWGAAGGGDRAARERGEEREEGAGWGGDRQRGAWSTSPQHSARRPRPAPAADAARVSRHT